MATLKREKRAKSRKTLLALFLLSSQAVILSALLLSNSSCENRSGRITITGETMGTSYRIIAINQPSATRSETELKKAIDAELSSIDELMSSWRSDSEISRFNAHSSDKPFEISPLTATVIAEMLRIWRLSSGAFDPSVGPLIELWGFGQNDQRRIPSPDEIATALKKSGLGGILLKENRLIKKKRKLNLNLSAIAKGYAVDRLAELLKESGYPAFMVEVGGEIRVGSRKADGSLWQLGVEEPGYDGKRNQLHSIIALENRALATSGDYRNYFTVEGKRYSHILDPRSGRPTTSGVIAATVIAQECMTADALATALMVLSPVDGLKLIESLPETEALILQQSQDGETKEFHSSGLKDFLVQK